MLLIIHCSPLLRELKNDNEIYSEWEEIRGFLAPSKQQNDDNEGEMNGKDEFIFRSTSDMCQKFSVLTAELGYDIEMMTFNVTYF